VRSSLAACFVALGALALGACGDSGPSTEEEVREAVVKAVESEDAKAFCRTMVTDHYLQLVYGGGVDKCIASDDAVPDDAGKAKVTAIRVDQKDEKKAEAAVAVSGGELDGTAGHLEMVEEEDGWKVDDVGDDYVRSTFLAAIENVDEGAVSTPTMKACFSRQVKTLDAATIRELTFFSYRGEKKEVTDALLPLAEKCPNALADYGAREFTKGLIAKGKSPAYVHCLRDEIRFFLELTDIVPALLQPNPDFASMAALEGIVEGAKKNCIDLEPKGA
jgi:hypothetical protein